MRQAVEGIRKKWLYLVFGLCMAMLCLNVHAKAYGETISGQVDYGKAASILAQANAKLSAQGNPTLKMDAYLQQIALHDAAITKMPNVSEASVSTYCAKPANEHPELKWGVTGTFGAAYRDEAKLVDEVVDDVDYYFRNYSDRMTGSGTLLVGIGYITNMSTYNADYEEWFPETSSTAAWCVVIGYGTCTPAPTSGVENRTFKNSSSVDYSSIKKLADSTAVKAASVKITGKTSVLAGKKITLNASVSPSNTTNKAVTWSSSNKKYATVSSKGVVTAKAAGAGKTVTITAKAKDGSGKKATFKVKIKGAVTKITLKGSKTLKAGKKTTIKATVKVGKGGSKAVTWSSSNKNYATVSSKGVVTAKTAGKGKTVTITAKAKDGSGKKASIKIKIK